VHESQLLALNKAWLVTLIAVVFFLASIGIRDVWDRNTFGRALESVLLSDAL
jgi:4-amino-4-deoxy-L-arabinose transferase-like glycosyltransferase